MSWINKLCETSPVPGELKKALSQIAAVWPPEFPQLEALVGSFPLGAEALCRLLSHSPVSVSKIVRAPQALLWLADAEVCAAGRSRRKMEVDWSEMKQSGADALASLRRFKAWELLRIALREVADISDILETGTELSSIAEICVSEIYEMVSKECEARWGNAGGEFVILGMGKLGGEELNYSSDIDLVFFFGEDGEVKPGFSRQDFFNRMAERMLALFSVRDAEGSLFKVDLRLRPEGGSGPLTRSITSMENYYAGFGETWERMALIKARRIAGSLELAYDFEGIMQAFIYPKTLSHDVVDEVSAIKSRIERDILEPDELYRNVKLGRGGIREIEFTVQTLQLLNGARNVFLQEKNTLQALAGLAQLDFLPGNDAQVLRESYIFLRKVEHRLQIINEDQIHTIPDKPEELQHLAWSLGFADDSSFLEKLGATMHNVRSIFESVLTSTNKKRKSKEKIEDSGNEIFSDPASAQKMLDKLGNPDASKHVSPRTRQIYERLRPLLLRELKKAAEPDSALAGFSDFVEAYGIRGMLFETLAANPRLLELLVKLFDASYFLTRAVIRRPQWIEEIARGGELGRNLTLADHLSGIQIFQTANAHSAMDRIRVYRQYQVLRIGLRDILGFCDMLELQREYTSLAEACVLEVIRVLDLEGRITVVAMGKFGGEELCYGSDLDLVIIGDDQAAAAVFIREMKSRTAEGLIFPVDVRLRPEGDSAPLSAPFETYKKYYEGRAQLWEIQSLTKARVLCGPLKEEVNSVIRHVLDKSQTYPELFAQVGAMHAKIVQNRSGVQDELYFKTGRGGLMAAEFIVQTLQIHHAVREPNTICALNALKIGSLLSTGDADSLHESYLFLRKVEACLRRIEDASISKLPEDKKKQGELSRHMGINDMELFFQKYREARSAIEKIFQRFFTPSA